MRRDSSSESTSSSKEVRATIRLCFRSRTTVPFGESLAFGDPFFLACDIFLLFFLVNGMWMGFSFFRFLLREPRMGDAESPVDTWGSIIALSGYTAALDFEALFAWLSLLERCAVRCSTSSVTGIATPSYYAGPASQPASRSRTQSALVRRSHQWLARRVLVVCLLSSSTATGVFRCRARGFDCLRQHARTKNIGKQKSNTEQETKKRTRSKRSGQNKNAQEGGWVHQCTSCGSGVAGTMHVRVLILLHVRVLILTHGPTGTSPTECRAGMCMLPACLPLAARSLSVRESAIKSHALLSHSLMHSVSPLIDSFCQDVVSGQ